MDLYSKTSCGDIKMTLASSAPDGWLNLNGDTISDTGDGGTHAGPEYEALFDIIKDVSPNAGTETWGTDTVTLPNFERRVPMGSGGTGTATIGNSLGDTGGSETHALTESEMPAHVHPVNTNLGSGLLPGFSYGGNGDGSSDINSDSTGGDGAHNNVQPAVIVRFVVKI